MSATRDRLLLVLIGEPLKEACVNRCTFVANTQEEVRHCAEDYNAGKIGSLADRPPAAMILDHWICFGEAPTYPPLPSPRSNGSDDP